MPDSTTSAGATPVAAGATPAQTTPVSPAAEPADTPAAPATGEPEIGEAGKRAIAAMKAERKAAEDRAKAAEAELEKLREATQTDREKELAQVKRETAAEIAAAYDARLIRADLRGRLKVAGVANEALIDLALGSPVFAGAKVDEEGRVVDGDKLVEKLKEAAPELFASPAKPAGPTAGAQTGQPPQARDLDSALLAHYKQTG
jgi:hypothetical protein